MVTQWKWKLEGTIAVLMAFCVVCTRGRYNTPALLFVAIYSPLQNTDQTRISRFVSFYFLGILCQSSHSLNESQKKLICDGKKAAVETLFHGEWIFFGVARNTELRAQ